ncbi:MAG: VanZ family protein [Deltaproteobacteria bacterium]|nr:VanZ family protein [Deltaproteobacteria bacterium]
MFDPAENQPDSIFTRATQWCSTWGYVIAWGAVIFTLSAQSDLSLPPALPPSSDKVAHFLVYGVLGWLWARAIRLRCPQWATMLVLLSTLAFTGLYGLSDEWHQMYVPGRSPDLYDALADLCGGTVGGAALLLWLRFREGTGAGARERDLARLPDPFDPAA